MGDESRVVVIGAGQAGLAVSHELTAHDIEHVVLERGRVAETWRRRWDSFCLVTPNWSVTLPGGEYHGPDPDGYMQRDAVVEHLAGYQRSFDAPVREGVEVLSLRPRGDDRFALLTSDGELLASQVVVATGAYQSAYRPASASRLPAHVEAIDADEYRNEPSLPSGPVLIVGSGQTGCQLAEELAEAGRRVYVACGRAPWAPRRLDGRDVFHWMVDSGFMDVPLSSLPNVAARLFANVQLTGHEGGHELNYRTLQRLGVALTGRLQGFDDRAAFFAPDLHDSVAFGDARYADVRSFIGTYCRRMGIAAPEMPPAPPFSAEPPSSIPLTEIGIVVFTAGFRPDYLSWIDVVGPAFDEFGFPLHQDGASTVARGLYFVGVHFLRKRKSSLLLGVGEDAALVARQVAASVGLS